MDRLIIVDHAGKTPVFLRADRVHAVLPIEHEGAWTVAAVMNADNVKGHPLAAGLSHPEAIALWMALRDWYSHRGGNVFDVAQWQLERRALAAAGTSVRRRRG